MEDSNIMTPTMRDTLKRTIGWINFYVIILYIISGLILVGITIISGRHLYFPFGAELLLFAGVIFIAFCIIYAISLGKYVKALRETVRSGDLNEITQGLSGYKTAFILSGIAAVLGIVITLASMFMFNTSYY